MKKIRTIGLFAGLAVAGLATLTSYAGWKQNADGTYYYTDANGKCLTGIQVINGKTYYFSSSGEWQK